LIFLPLSHIAYADHYPRNYNIDVLHYSFKLILSDTTDEIKGTALITVLFKKDDIGQFRLDLVNKTPDREGKGMTIESITLINGKAVYYTHKNDEVLINLPNTVRGSEMVFVIHYHGVPAD